MVQLKQNFTEPLKKIPASTKLDGAVKAEIYRAIEENPCFYETGWCS
jgi:hypothetical protein